VGEGRRSPWLQSGRGLLGCWAFDLGTVRCYFTTDSQRVNFPTHSPPVAQVTWARHDAGHTCDLDNLCASFVTRS
jgi:hypothetical protein